MAKIYDRKKNEVYWSDSDIACVVEDAYFELSDFLAVKKLDGHDRLDQWYMTVHAKLTELMGALDNCPIDELGEDIRPIY